MSDPYCTLNRYLFPQMYYLFCYHQSAIFKGQSYNEACYYVLNSITFFYLFITV